MTITMTLPAGELTFSSPSSSSASTSTPCRIDDATDAHVTAIQQIYAHYVLNERCSFEEVAPTVAQMQARLDDVRRAGMPYLVASVDGQVVGYAYATAYRPRPAYRHTVEDSIYVAPGMHGRGIGTALMAALIEHCEGRDFTQMVAVVGDSANEGSLRLHERAGFRRVGTLQKVGFKFGQWVDTVLMQRGLAARE
jgi:L-amino acid N-acyltransferase YncA